MKRNGFIVWLLLSLFTYQHVQAQDQTKMVIVIGVDGFNVKNFESANTPTLDNLKTKGSWTLDARAILPTSSSPNWASMIMGAGPKEHEITSNDWKRSDYIEKPTCASSPGHFPTIFGEYRKINPDAKIGVIHQWLGFGRLVEPKVTNKKRWTFISPKRTMKTAKRFIRHKTPELTFIHLDNPDHAGHAHSHGSWQYIKAIETVDREVEKLVIMLKKKGLYDNTYILLTSDHGGIGFGHGGKTKEEVTIPWMLIGPGIKANHEIQTKVITYDTALTLAKILGVTPHECWIGKSIDEVFE